MYQKPVVSALGQESESCGCCFYFTNSGQGVYVYPSDGGSGEPNPNLATIGGAGGSNGTASVTPLCGTGLPATQPIVFGVPVGATGVGATVPADGRGAEVVVNTDALGASVLGHGVSLGGGLPGIHLPVPV